MDFEDMIADRIYGIDLGTTYSCISYVDETSGVPVIIANEHEQLTTPSVVYIDTDKSFVVGQTAKNKAKFAPERVVSFIKREMGTDYTVALDGETYNPQVISSYILKKLVQDATGWLQEQGKLKYPIRRVVITIPAYFGQTERDATKEAGRIAGLEVVDIINEPTAAALSYRAGQPPTDDVLLVYDLGGGTFDITHMLISGTSIQEVAIAGDSRRGGYDWDNVLLDMIIERFMEKHPELTQAPTDEAWRKGMMENAEQLKKDLSRNDVSSIVITYGTVAAEIEITRAEFEEETESLLEGTMDSVKEVLKKADYDSSLRPHRVYLVGGSTKMKAVSHRLEEVLFEHYQQKVEIIPRDPDLAVAKGAAFHGFILRLKEIMEKNKGDFGPLVALFPKTEPYLKAQVFYSVLSRGLGFQVRDSASNKPFVDHLLHQNARLPVEATADGYTTLADNQASVLLPVYEQGGARESKEPENNNRIGEVLISGLESMNLPKGSPLQATLRVERDGTVHATGKEMRSGKEVKVRLKIAGGMSEPDIEGAIKQLADAVVKG